MGRHVAVWEFHRAGEILWYETWYDAATREYALASEEADGRSTVERFHSDGAFTRRLRELEGRLLAEGWEQIGGPMLDARRRHKGD